MSGTDKHMSGETPYTAAEQYRQTADEHVRTLKDFWKDFLVSGLFVLAAIVIIFACLAWFAANNSVSATGSTISAKANEFALMVNLDESKAQKGMYENETSVIKHGLSTADAMLVNDESNFNNVPGGTSTELGPGSAGKFELKIHRYNKALKNFTVTIDLAKSAGGKGVTDEKLSSLLNGHIQFFTAKDADGFYSGLLLPDADADDKRSLSVSFTDNDKDEQTFTVYWVWPLRMSNIIAPGGSRYDLGLFKSAESADYKSLMADFNYKDATTGQYSHRDRYFDDEVGTAGEISNEMDNLAYATSSNQYDAADDYIGSNVQYIQVRFEASVASSIDANNGEQ